MYVFLLNFYILYTCFAVVGHGGARGETLMSAESACSRCPSHLSQALSCVNVLQDPDPAHCPRWRQQVKTAGGDCQMPSQGPAGVMHWHGFGVQKVCKCRRSCLGDHMYQNITTLRETVLSTLSTCVKILPYLVLAVCDNADKTTNQRPQNATSVVSARCKLILLNFTQFLHAEHPSRPDRANPHPRDRSPTQVLDRRRESRGWEASADKSGQGWRHSSEACRPLWPRPVVAACRSCTSQTTSLWCGDSEKAVGPPATTGGGLEGGTRVISALWSARCVLMTAGLLRSPAEPSSGRCEACVVASAPPSRAARHNFIVDINTTWPFRHRTVKQLSNWRHRECTTGNSPRMAAGCSQRWYWCTCGSLPVPQHCRLNGACLFSI